MQLKILLSSLFFVFRASAGCSHVLINSECWLSNCFNQTQLQCGEFNLNVTMPDFRNFLSVNCFEVSRNIPLSFISKQFSPDNIYNINVTTDKCGQICQLFDDL